MDNLKILTVFINEPDFSNRKEFYKKLINEKFYEKNYSDIFLLGINCYLQIKKMDWIKPKIPQQEFWQMPFRLDDDSVTEEIINYSFEAMYLDRINHLKSEKNIRIIDYCIEYNLKYIEISINDIYRKKEYENFIVNKILLTNLS